MQAGRQPELYDLTGTMMDTESSAVSCIQRSAASSSDSCQSAPAA